MKNEARRRKEYNVPVVKVVKLNRRTDLLQGSKGDPKPYGGEMD